MSVEKCSKNDDSKYIVVSDKKSKEARFINDAKESIKIIRVDGCVINDGIRADYALRFSDDSCIIIELKGGKVAHALDQIEATAQNGLKNSWLKKPIAGLVVGSKVSPAISTVLQRAKLAHKTKYNAHLHVRSSGFEWKKADFF